MNRFGSGLVLTVLISIVLGSAPFGIMDAYAQPVLYGIAYEHGTGGFDPDAPSTLYAVSPSTGASIPVGPVGFLECSGMDQDPATGIMYATCHRPGDLVQVLVTINLTTGQGTEVGPVVGGNVGSGADRISDISFRNSDSTLYGYGGPDGPVFTININSGAATQVGPFPSHDPPLAGNTLAFSLTDTLYHQHVGGPPPSLPPTLLTVNQNNGAESLVSVIFGPTGNNPRFNAFEFNPSTGTLYGSSVTGNLNLGFGPTLLWTINLGNNIATLQGQTVDGIDALAFVDAPDCTSDADCNDSNACTTDTCNTATGQCSNPAIVCDDNDACNGLESCDTATGCVAGTPLVCNDGQFCTLDSCNTATGCVFAPNPDPSCQSVGGEFIGVDNSALLVTGFEANALWLLPAIAAIGIGVVVIRRIR